MKFIDRKLAIISIVVNFLFLFFFIGKRIYYSHSSPPVVVKAANEQELWRKTRVDIINSMPVDSSDIVFVGNSLTNGFEINEMLAHTHFKNRGVGGYTIKDILGSISHVIEGKPQKIFLEAGINDLSQGVEPANLFRDYVNVICKIRRASPKTKIYVNSIFPAGMDKSFLNDKIVDINRQLRRYCSDNGIQYINVHDELTVNGVLDSTLTFDGIHLDGKGYEIWKDKIKKFVL